ncbi:uncharacterized protein LOC116765720 [Danaus plexippus]|uniref:uncharacterized protein LOC116765720 n=1 Tax=Danaus plexippus TaxID=13037 RepID=UPI002AAF8D8B|nr:uncharacterized protein LOC116765720 [Danaus plexippus]
MKWLCYAVICHLCSLGCLAMSQSEIEDFSNFLRQTSSLDQNLKSLPEGDYEEDVSLDDDHHAWEKSGKFEGDLILNERQRRMIVNNVVEGLARNGLTDSTKRWPNNEVIYFIQPDHFSDDQVRSIQNGIEDLARASCVKFRPYVKGDADAVVIQGSKRGCFSQVGYQGGYQILNLSRRHPADRGCFRLGTVVHELLHTLGFFHMQSSPDRDEFIDVLWDNIIRQARHNFRKYDSLSVSDFGVGYDYDSVLHYSRKAFSSNGQDTLVPKNGADIGQRIGLSEKDIVKLNKMYCDVDAGVISQDSISSFDMEKKRKGAKNKPFVGQGLGYQKGKTVIIKLPKADEQNSPKNPVRGYFSETTQTIHPTFNLETGPKEDTILYDYQFPGHNINEYMSLLPKKKEDQDDYKELKIIDANNDDKRNSYFSNEGSIGESDNRDVLRFSQLPAVLQEDKDEVEDSARIYYYGQSDSLSPHSVPIIEKQQIKAKNAKHLAYPHYDTLNFQPNRFSEKDSDFLYGKSKQDSPRILPYNPSNEFADSEWHLNENYKPNFYIQEDGQIKHDKYDLPKIGYNYELFQ